MSPLFLTLEEVLAIHHDQIERYGGMAGIRDVGLLESGLRRRKPDLETSTSTAMHGKWLQPTSIIWRRTIPSSTGTSVSERLLH